MARAEITITVIDPDGTVTECSYYPAPEKGEQIGRMSDHELPAAEQVMHALVWAIDNFPTMEDER